ncbi:Tyrosine recombinase XerA [uncultured archaeon]|nr:Tyrosine recombinase XerA [uncultured archaeon]
MALERIKDRQLIEMFAKDCRTRGLTSGTIAAYSYSLIYFSKFLQGKGYTLLSVERNILRDYIAHIRQIGFKQKTIENHFSAFASFYDYIVYEEWAKQNIVKDVQKRYLKTYKDNDNGTNQRKLISVEEMSHFINLILDIRDKAICIVFAKTGIRRGELIAIDLDDIDWIEMSIILKPTRKRSNRVVFFDNECAMVLQRWIRKREQHVVTENKALFVPYTSRRKRLNRSGVDKLFIKWATIAGLHDPNSDKIEDHFTPHCSRHWFTTYLRRAGMPREFIQELRGDARTGAIDIYDHIDRDELKKSYLATIPQLGLE